MGEHITKEAFRAIRETIKNEGKKIVHCHGVFDLIHPGHIIYFKEARKMGDVLVVSVTAGNYVQKGPGRPYFNDELRILYLSALDVIDYVILDESVAALDIIDVVRPNFYVKGEEYANSENDITANIDKEVARVRQYGGDVAFTSGQTFSSTKLINRALNGLSEEALQASQNIKEAYSMQDIRAYVDKFEDTKVLVIGDVVIDEYIFCEIQGIMSKDQAYSSRYVKTEQYLGGALAIAKHLAGLSKHVTVCSILGDETDIRQKISDEMGSDVSLELSFMPDVQTIIKRRYLQQRGKREEYNKIFSINYLENKHYDKEIFYNKLRCEIKNYDLVVLCDFGHGLIDQMAMDIIQQNAHFLALNCQTNSSNYGLNLITKYEKVDAFVLDEKELTLAFHDNQTDKGELLHNLKTQFQARYGWLTMGSSGAIGLDMNNTISKNPAATLVVKDTVGAGDAFFSVASLCAYHQLPIEVSTMLGNCAGAMITNVLGNAASIHKVPLLKFAATVLNV